MKEVPCSKLYEETVSVRHAAAAANSRHILGLITLLGAAVDTAHVEIHRSVFSHLSSKQREVFVMVHIYAQHSLLRICAHGSY